MKRDTNYAFMLVSLLILAARGPSACGQSVPDPGPLPSLLELEHVDAVPAAPGKDAPGPIVPMPISLEWRRFGGNAALGQLANPFDGTPPPGQWQARRRARREPGPSVIESLRPPRGWFRRATRARRSLAVERPCDPAETETTVVNGPTIAPGAVSEAWCATGDSTTGAPNPLLTATPQSSTTSGLPLKNQETDEHPRRRRFWWGWRER